MDLRILLRKQEAGVLVPIKWFSRGGLIEEIVPWKLARNRKTEL